MFSGTGEPSLGSSLWFLSESGTGELSLSDLQAHEVENLAVAQVGDPVLAARADDILGQFFFAVDEGVDPLLDRAGADQLVDDDVLLLADAEGAVGCLVFDGRVPPT